jgi:hypothetical protein
VRLDYDDATAGARDAAHLLQQWLRIGLMNQYTSAKAHVHGIAGKPGVVSVRRVKLDISQAEFARIFCCGFVLSGLNVHADVTSAHELPGDPEIGAGAGANLTHGVGRTKFQIGSITIELALAVKPLLLVGTYA